MTGIPQAQGDEFEPCVYSGGYPRKSNCTTYVESDLFFPEQGEEGEETEAQGPGLWMDQVIIFIET